MLSKITKLYYLIILALTLFSCRKEKVAQACFISDKNNVIPNEIITFRDCSINSENIEWNFGDSNDSDIKNPTHKYSKEGSYQVAQTVYDENNNASELTQSIEVNLMEMNKISVTTPNDFPNLESIDLDFYLNDKNQRFRLEKVGDYYYSTEIEEATLIENSKNRFVFYCWSESYVLYHNFYDVIDLETMSYKFTSIDGVEYKFFFSKVD